MEATVASEKALWMLDWRHLSLILNLFTVIYFKNCIDSLVTLMYQWLKRACGALDPLLMMDSSHTLTNWKSCPF